MANYKNRVADGVLAEKLAGKGAVLIEGAKWCGKTTTAEQVAKSVLYLGDKDSQARNLQIADRNGRRRLRLPTERRRNRLPHRLPTSLILFAPFSLTTNR